MIHLPHPDVDDLTMLRTLANTPGLASYPLLQRRLRRISGRYRTYVEALGNAWEIPSLRRSALPDVLRVALRSHYDTPPQLIGYLSRMRSEASPDICSMCGAPKSGTLDHVFPKAQFPEFSFFSGNLVPACDCNTKRGERFKGRRREERVLHPYFDGALKRRLIRASLSAGTSGYSRPGISLKICVRSSNPIYTAVKYHLENVIERTDVVPYLCQYWKRILRNPEDHLSLPSGAFTKSQFDHAVREELRRLDRRRSPRNNWESMLFAGLTASTAARTFLIRTVRDLRTGRINAADV